MSARDELLSMTVAEARCSPVLRALLDQAAQEAENVEHSCHARVIRPDGSETVRDVARWACGLLRYSFESCRPFPADRVATLYSLLALLGYDVSMVWVETNALRHRDEVLERVAAKSLRSVREGG